MKLSAEKKWKEQVGESHGHDCSAHLQQLRQFLRRVTEALLQRQLKRLHLGVVTRPLGSQWVTDIAREIKGINMKKSKNKRFCKRKAPSSQSTFSFKIVQDQSFASLWFCPGFFVQCPFSIPFSSFLSLRPTLCLPGGSQSLAAGPSEQQGLVLQSQEVKTVLSVLSHFMPFYALSLKI